MRRVFAALILAACFPGSTHDAFAAVPSEARLVSGEELAEFLGPVSPGALTWKKLRGPDFDVYYGVANQPLSGNVSFYLGGHPSFRPEPKSTVVESRLGIFPVQWHKTTNDGSVTQHALISLDQYWKVDISVHANTEKDVDQLLAIISQLPTFTKKPKPIGSQ